MNAAIEWAVNRKMQIVEFLSYQSQGDIMTISEDENR